MKRVTEDIVYVGADDYKTTLFENQYPIVSGVSYNSYVIVDRKIAVMDTVDDIVSDPWFDNLEEAFAGKCPDYLIVSHLEPDHSGNIASFMEKYPETVIVGSEKMFSMLPQFFDIDIPDAQKLVVKEGDSLKLGVHELIFYMAPMVHWPEVMVSYETKEKVLFSADGFGTFGSIKDHLFADETEGMPYGWLGEARRYYANIVGKYGSPVQTLLKKAAGLDIAVIAPLHGYVLRKDLDFYIGMYDKWSSYTPEEDGVVVVYSTLHGNTGKAAQKTAQLIKEKSNLPVAVYDLSRVDMSYVCAAVSRFSKMVLLGVSYDGGLMPCMEDFLYHLRIKMSRGRKAALVENGSWAPVAGKLMRQALEKLTDYTICDKMVSIKTTMKDEDEKALSDMVDELLK